MSKREEFTEEQEEWIRKIAKKEALEAIKIYRDWLSSLTAFEPPEP